MQLKPGKRDGVLPLARMALLACAIVVIAEPTKAGGKGDIPETGALEEMVVVARRREEWVQEVPLAITAFRPETLERQAIQTINDLERMVPGLNVGNVASERGNVDFIWMRGVPGVVGYFAEVPVNLGGGAMYFDLENVGVLKGPQGTLFGLSTNGGAVLFTPAKPGKTFGGYAQTTQGSLGRSAVEAVLNLPFQEDRLRVRVGVKSSHVAGYQHDLFQNKALGDENEKLGRVSVTMRPGDTLENTLVLNRYQFHNNGSTNILAAVNPDGLASQPFVHGPAAMNALLARQQSLGAYAVAGGSVPGGSFSRLEQTNFVDTAAWRITDQLVLKNILGYQKASNYDRLSCVNIPLPIYEIYDTRHALEGVQKSEELQLQGETGDGKLYYTLGSFLSWAHNVVAPGELLGRKVVRILGNATESDSDKSARTRALYGQGNVDLSKYLDGLVVTAGLRKTWDARSLNVTQIDSAGGELGRSFDSGHWSALSHTGSLSWKATPATLWFLTHSRGYSSGGFNTDPSTPPEFRVYQPEFLTNLEFGVKSDWQLAGVKARTNASVFHSRYRNIQASVLVPATGAPPGTFAVVTANAAKGHIDGLDAEATLIPFDALELSGNLAWLVARYDEYTLGDGSDGSARHFVYVPKLKYGLRLSYRLPLDPAFGRLDIATDYTRQTRMNQSFDKIELGEQDWIPALSNLNLSLNWKGIAGQSNVDGTLFVTNVWNNKLSSGGLPLYDSLGVLSRAVAAPRMWGARLRYGF